MFILLLQKSLNAKKNRMMRVLITFLLLLFMHSLSIGQDQVLSLGLFTGITTTYSIDKGINQDSRYQEKYDIKFAPIGLNFGIDYDGFGFVISPGLIHTGQNFYVVNTSGGQDGQRKISQWYLNVPAALKFHIIDLSFFKVSLIGGASLAYLTKAEESVSHDATKLRFVPEIYPILPLNYTIVYDGVLVPKIKDYEMLKKSEFSPLQIFVLAGFRTDWDMSDVWRLSVDFRVNYGLLEPRTENYINSLNNYEELYALPGNRKDTFVQFSVGISRYIIVEKRDRDRKKQTKGSTRNHSKKYPWSSPRKSKPKQ
jgi:Outer membrane protein beta-barrel domain